MHIHRRLFLLAGTSALLAPSAFAQNSPGASSNAPAAQFDLGRSWRVIESSASGLLFEGTWTRRGDSNVFDARWREVRKNAGSVSDVIEFRSIEGEEVQLFRRQLNGTYYGRLNAERTKIVSGRASWYGAGDAWNADILF